MGGPLAGVFGQGVCGPFSSLGALPRALGPGIGALGSGGSWPGGALARKARAPWGPLWGALGLGGALGPTGPGPFWPETWLGALWFGGPFWLAGPLPRRPWWVARGPGGPWPGGCLVRRDPGSGGPWVGRGLSWLGGPLARGPLARGPLVRGTLGWALGLEVLAPAEALGRETLGLGGPWPGGPLAWGAFGRGVLGAGGCGLGGPCPWPGGPLARGGRHQKPRN